MESDSQSGAPSRYELIQVSSHEFDPSIRYDAWKAIAYHAVDLLPPQDGEPLVGSLRFVRGDRGAFGSHEGDRRRTQFTSRARNAGLGECMVINLMTEGMARLDAPDGTQLAVQEGSLAIYDATRPMRYSWSRSRDIHLLLPRPAVLKSLGGDIAGLSLSLETAPLAPFLRSQMILLDRHGATLSRKELTAMLDSTVALAMLLLDGLNGGPACEAEMAASGLYAGALRHLDMNFQRRDLDPGTIAREIGCSRATLYRAFQANGATVAEALRDLRLERARERLSASAAFNLNVAAVAFACGFQDASSFGKQFRARFGLSPRDWRELSRTGDTQTA